MKKAIAMILGLAALSCGVSACSDDLTADQEIFKPYCEMQTVTSFKDCINQLEASAKEDYAKNPKCDILIRDYKGCVYQYADPKGAEAQKCDTKPLTICLLDNYLEDGSENTATLSTLTLADVSEAFCTAETDQHDVCVKTYSDKISEMVTKAPKCENAIYNVFKCNAANPNDANKCEGVIRKTVSCLTSNDYDPNLL